MMFSTSKKYDFPPEVTFEDGSILETISETKLLGVVISDDLKWQKNTSYICMRARQKLWFLRRLLLLDLSVNELFDVYKKEIRTVLEYAIPVWHSGITRRQSAEIESIQKLSFRIILRDSYTSYSQACFFFNTDTLKKRREAICLKFALKDLKNENSLFTPYNQHPALRQRKTLVQEYKSHTKRFQKSSLPFLAGLVNSRP